ncbi:MAG: LysM peptidoglycan-binding domain-containing protein [Verrucomicrobiota bacterium]
MKQLLVFIVLASTFIAPPLRAQNAASVIAERQEADERYKRMSTDVESVLGANVALQKKVSALENELQRLREDHAQLRKASNNDNTTESLRKLAEKIQEVDRKREADKELIIAEFGKLGKKLETSSTPRTPRNIVAPEAPPSSDKGYPYTIKSNDTLSAIVSDINTQFKSNGMKTITQKQVSDANPNVNWSKLKIGQKIFIPAPSEK